MVLLDPAPALCGFGVLTAAGTGAGALLPGAGSGGPAVASGSEVTADLRAACGEFAAALRRADRYGALGFTAACLAIRDAGVDPPQATDPSWGVTVGSALGCWGSNARHHRWQRGDAGLDPSPAGFVRTVSNAVNGDISIAWRLGGPSATFVSGWTAGAEALIEAGAAVAFGRARRMLACGVEAPEGPFRALYAEERRRPEGAWLPEALAEGAAAILVDADGAPDAPRLAGFARGGDRPGSWSLAALRREGPLPPIGRLVIANTLPPRTRAAIETDAAGLEVIDLPARAGEIGAAGAVTAVAVAAAARGANDGHAAARRPAGALVLARDAQGGLAILAISG
jgi:beta-ketoacyl synthase-like protein